MGRVAASLREAAEEVLKGSPHEKHYKLAAATEEYNDLTTDVVCLLNAVAERGS